MENADNNLNDKENSKRNEHEVIKIMVDSRPKPLQGGIGFIPIFLIVFGFVSTLYPQIIIFILQMIALKFPKIITLAPFSLIIGLLILSSGIIMLLGGH